MPSRPAADDDYIGRHLRAFNAFDRFAEENHVARFQSFKVSEQRFQRWLMPSRFSLKPCNVKP